MTNVLLFKNSYLKSEEKDKRVEAFGQTLNNLFEQFQNLWDNYKQLLEKSEQSEKNSSNALNGLQNAANGTEIKYCTCSTMAKGNVTAEKESAAVPEKIEVTCKPLAVAIEEQYAESIKPNYDQNFQIFSQDFCTQGLEESFSKQNQTPLQEIQNVTPTRAKSPVFGFKKGKSRVASSPASSPNLSEKSVVIINDFTTETNSKLEDCSVLNISLDSDTVTTTRNAVSSPIQLSSPVSHVGKIQTPKNVKRLGISTIHNVNTDVIAGTNKKLKQSKLYLQTEKITDLSNCDDVDTNYTPTNNSCLEDSLIQVSPTHKRGFSKIRLKMALRNKSAEIPQQKFNIDMETITNVKRSKTIEHTSVNTGQTDTEITIFEPRLASTQYGSSPSDFESSKMKISSIKDKLGFGKRIDTDNGGNNDCETNDETLFIENVPTPSWSQKKPSSEKIMKKKQLSLKKVSTASRDPEVILNDSAKASDKEVRESEIDRFGVAPNFEELDGRSPPRKKLAMTNFEVPMKKRNTSPTYAYKGSPVRKQAERALLNGWSCWDCQKYYEAMGLNEAELQERKNKCSRHRSKFNEKKVSQGDYWAPEFGSSFHSTIWGDD